MNDKWMNDLKDLADSYEKTPPQGLLDDIRREMTSRNIMPASQPLQARRVPMWRQPRIAAAAVALLLVGAATIGYIVSGRQPAPMATSVNTHQAAPMPPVTMPAPAALPTAMAAEGSPAQHLHVHPAATPSATTPLMTVVRHIGQMTGLLPDSLQETTTQPLLATTTPTHHQPTNPLPHQPTT
ncbi:MAG: hypothetical protein I3J02_09700, partial [Prevotella sp.]|nr:hypothetical protein [Prevotella sp.]